MFKRRSFHAGQFRVNHNTTTVLAHNDFFVHFDFHLLLRRNSVEATSTCVTLDVNDTQTIAGILADAFEGCKCACVNFGFKGLGLFTQALFILLGFRYNFLEFSLLFSQNVVLIRKGFFCSGYVGSFVVNHTLILVDVLFRKLNLKSLEFNFLG